MPKIYTECHIGLTIATLAPLSYLNVAPPDQALFFPSSANIVRWDYSRVGDGYAAAHWIYDVISAPRLYTLLSFLDGAESKELYVATPLMNGLQPYAEYDVFYGTLWRPSLSGQEGVPIARSLSAYQTVKLQFVNLIEVDEVYL